MSQAALWLGRAWVGAQRSGSRGRGARLIRWCAPRGRAWPASRVWPPARWWWTAARRWASPSAGREAGSRLQCAVINEWDPRPLVDLLDLSPSDRAALTEDLAASAVGIGPVDPATLVAALADALA